ncbi:MAG: Ppx/GppA family phosphatase [Acidothermus cellulolyticus]|nr:Ppx/GppA family phosphatase [Acidothermus cellulolyticus]
MTVARAAAIDCGTNSLRLLIADVDGGQMRELVRRMRIVRLGAGVDRSRRLDPAAVQRTLEVCREYAAEIRHLGAEVLRFAATSATRDAANRDEFFRGVRDILGVEPEVISGDEEARLSFLGATHDLSGLTGVPAPFLVVDIGGGSTEFVLGTAEPEAAVSVNIGCVRLTERHVRHDPPTAAEIEALRRDVEQGLDEAARVVPLQTAATVVGLAGSVTTVAALALGLDTYDPRRVHHARIPADVVHEITEDLLRSTRAERAARAVIHPGRVDVLAAGAVILDAVLTRAHADAVLASEHDILDGLVLSVALRPEMR